MLTAGSLVGLVGLAWATFTGVSYLEVKKYGHGQKYWPQQIGCLLASGHALNTVSYGRLQED